MTKEELQNKISQFINEDTHECNIYVVLKNGSTKLLNIEQKDLDELTKVYFGCLEERCIASQFHLMNYSTADERKDCYYLYDLPDVPESFKCLSSLPNHSDDLDLSKNQLRDIVAILAILYNGKNRIGLYKCLYSVEIVAAKKKFVFYKSDKRFVKASEDLLRITPGIDVLSMDNQAFILNIKAVEKNDQFTQIIENEAISNIENLKASGIVSNLDDVSSMLKGDISLSKKFIQAVKQSPVFRLGISNIKIIEFAKKKEKQIGKITYGKDDVTFSPKSKMEMKRILSLISDDLLKSELTEGEYITSSKDPLKQLQ